MLKLYRRIGFATNWNLVCDLCDKESVSFKNGYYYLKMTLGLCGDHIERWSTKNKMYKKREQLVQFNEKRKERNKISPVTKHTD